MSDVLHANIFFFITSAAVVLCALAFLVVAYYLITILQDVRTIVRSARDVSEDIEEDIYTLRKQIAAEGVKIRTIIGLSSSFFSHTFRTPSLKPKKKKKPAAKKPQTEEIIEGASEDVL